MLPVVRGEDETRRQIFLYSLRAVRDHPGARIRSAGWGPSTSPPPSCSVGCSSTGRCELWREPDANASWRLFKYSIVYLAALFGAVALDALAPLGRRAG